MHSKLIFALIFLTSIYVINGQNEIIHCKYVNNNLVLGYYCELTIVNPNGLNNFNDISGQHVDGKSNEDVMSIYSYNISNSIIFPSIICQKFPNLKIIKANYFGLKTIDDYSFKNCNKLQEIHIQKNKINQIHENSFQNNPDITLLSLESNEIAVLPEKIFTSLQKLQILDLGNNRIINLPANVFNPLISLDLLLLNENLINNLPANVFSGLKNMTQIQLFKNKLEILHSHPFGVLPKLKSASLHNNKMYAMDEKFIDNTGINLIQMVSNICADKRIEDLSPTRNLLKMELQRCFDNYRIIYG